MGFEKLSVWRSISNAVGFGFISSSYCNLRGMLSDGRAAVRGAFYILFYIIFLGMDFGSGWWA